MLKGGGYKLQHRNLAWQLLLQRTTWNFEETAVGQLLRPCQISVLQPFLNEFLALLQKVAHPKNDNLYINFGYQ